MLLPVKQAVASRRQSVCGGGVAGGYIDASWEPPGGGGAGGGASREGGLTYWAGLTPPAHFDFITIWLVFVDLSYRILYLMGLFFDAICGIVL